LQLWCLCLSPFWTKFDFQSRGTHLPLDLIFRRNPITGVPPHLPTNNLGHPSFIFLRFLFSCWPWSSLNQFPNESSSPVVVGFRPNSID
jgi:hypothetical protein